MPFGILVFDIAIIKDFLVPAPNNYGVAGSPNSAIAHPDGLNCYGRVPEINSKGDVIPAGVVAH